MTGATNLHHDTLSLERRFDHPVGAVFAAFSKAEACAEWMCPAPGAQVTCAPFDFREGGLSVTTMDMAENGVWTAADHYVAIVPDRLILMHSSLRGPGGLDSATVVTVRFEGDEDGCAITLTEQGAFMRGSEAPRMHESGWAQMFECLVGFLGRN